MSERGSFGYRTIVGSTDSYWGPGVYEEPVMGLPAAGQHIWGALDVGGKRVWMIRHFMNEMAGRCLRYEGLHGSDLEFRAHRPYSGLCDIGTFGDQWGIHQPSEQPAFRYTTAPGEGRWVDAGVDLILRPRPVALQFVTPDRAEPLAYFARAFDVIGGSCDGETVEQGVVMHEQVYLRSGRGWMLSRYKRELQGAWVAFANCYEDGTTEFGSVAVGDSGWSFAAIIPSHGPEVCVDAPAGHALASGDELDLELDLGDAGVWRWHPPAAGGGRVPLPGSSAHVPIWREGAFRRDGDERTPTFSHTWAEYYPRRINGSATARPT